LLRVYAAALTTLLRVYAAALTTSCCGPAGISVGPDSSSACLIHKV